MKNSSAQLHSRITKFLLPCHSVYSVVNRLSAQPDSKMTNGRLSGVFCWPQGQDIKNLSAQPDSKISNREMGVMGRIGGMGRMGQKYIIKNSPAQRDSKMTKSGVCCSNRPSRTVDLRTCPRRAKVTTSKTIFESSPVQQDSKMTNLVLPLCSLRPLRLNRLSAQPDSKMTNRGMGGMGRIGGMGRMGQKYIIKNSPAQRDSKNSNSVFPLCSLRPLRLDRLSAQLDSNISKCGMSPMGHMSPMGQKTVRENLSAQQHSKFSKFKKNQTLHFIHGLHGEEMYSAQQHSKFSNGRLSGVFCWPQGQDIKNLSAQQHSKFSKFKKNQTLHFIHGLHGEEMYSAQWDSRMSNFEICFSNRPSRTVDFRACLRRAKATTPKTIFKDSLVQRDSNLNNS